MKRRIATIYRTDAAVLNAFVTLQEAMSEGRVKMLMFVVGNSEDHEDYHAGFSDDASGWQCIGAMMDMVNEITDEWKREPEE